MCLTKYDFLPLCEACRRPIWRGQPFALWRPQVSLYHYGCLFPKQAKGTRG